jgi:hypothetical protein
MWMLAMLFVHHLSPSERGRSGKHQLSFLQSPTIRINLAGLQADQ